MLFKTCNTLQPRPFDQSHDGQEVERETVLTDFSPFLRPRMYLTDTA